jgi:hypothetical protein
MPAIVSSTYTTGHLQADGRRYIKERHLLDDGRSVDFEYLADAQINPVMVMTERAARLSAELQAQEASSAEAANGVIPLTKYQFRQRFTFPERVAIDQFNGGVYLVSDALTAEQKASITMMLEDYKAATEVRLSDPATIAAVQMYEGLGLIVAGRASEVLNG